MDSPNIWRPDIPNKRPQVRDLRDPEPFQPAPIQSDTFTGAPHVSGAGRGYHKLAQALGHFDSGLRYLYAAGQRRQAKSPALENAFGKLTNKERVLVAQTGELPDGTKITNSNRPAIMKAGGIAAAATDVNSLKQDMVQSYDWEHGDVDNYLTGAQNKMLKASGLSDPFAIKGYLDRFSKMRSWAVTEQEKHRATAQENYTENSAYTIMQDHVNDMIEAGRTPEEVHKGLRSLYSQLGKAGVLGLDYQKLDQFTMNIAGDIAKAHPDVAIELLTSKRKGAGPASSPIIDNNKYRQQAHNIILTADKAKVKMHAAREEQQLYQSNAKRVLTDHDFDPFKPVTIDNGTQDGKKITVKDQKDNFTNYVVGSLQREVQHGNISQQNASEQEVRYLRPMGLDHPYLKDKVDHIEKSVGLSLASGNNQLDQDELKDFSERIHRYRELRAASKTYTLSQLSEPTKKFLDLVDMSQKYMHYDMQEAILNANRAFNPTEGQAPSMGHYHQQIDDAVSSQFDSGKGWLNWDWGSGSILEKNPNQGVMMGTIKAKVQSFAKMLMTTGMSADKAIPLAAKRVHDNTPLFHGRMMPGLENQVLAPKWQSTLDNIIKTKILPSESKTFNGEDLFPVVQDGGRIYFETGDGVIALDKQGNVMATSVSVINAQARQDAKAERQTDAEIQRAIDRHRNGLLEQHKREEELGAPVSDRPYGGLIGASPREQ